MLLLRPHVYFLVGLLLTLSTLSAMAQQVRFSGRVTEGKSGKAVPFASVFVPGSSQGTTADENGRFTLTVAQPIDSLGASALGFTPRKKAVRKESPQTVNFALGGDGGFTLGEVTVRPPGEVENPAYRILRLVQAHKDQNNKRTLTAFEFDSYNRLQVFLANMPRDPEEGSLFQQIQAVADSLGALGDTTNGRVALPIFASEALSRFYVHSQPRRTREEIRHTQMRGLTPREGSVLSQIMGTSFQDWDFYRNWQQLLGKDFISPIADGWKFTYEYELQDSVFLGSEYCYRIAVEPRRPADLAFTGLIWINAETYALRRVDLRVSPTANVNFADNIIVQQDMVASAAGPGLPRRTHVELGIKPLKKSPAFRAEFTTINSDFVVNQDRPAEFYNLPIETLASAYETPPGFWEANRPDTLTAREQGTFATLDSVQKLPEVRTVLDIMDIAVNGYYRVGKLDLGPVLSTYAFNSIEGHRFQFGFRTTPAISRDWLLRTYLAYGTRDNRFKYGAQVSRILDRRTWTVATVERRRDIEQIALLDNAYALDNPLFEASARLGNIRSSRPLIRDLSSISLQSDLFRGFTQKVMVRHQQFRPLYPFAYYTDVPAPGAPTDDNFTLSEVVVESRYARDQVLVQSQTQNRRYAIGLMRWPVFTLRYTMGLNNVLGSDFKYQKLNLLVTQSVKFGQLGRTDYILDAGYIPSTVPYPLLKNHLGNQTPFYNAGAYNLMRYFEFVSDKYVSLQLENHLDGFLVNSVPLLRRLNWRLLVTGNVLYGGISAANRAINPTENRFGEPLPTFQALGQVPYAEVGYGVENIFKIVRVDFIHRLTYRDSPGARNFGAKVSFQFRL